MEPVLHSWMIIVNKYGQLGYRRYIVKELNLESAITTILNFHSISSNTKNTDIMNLAITRLRRGMYVLRF